MGLERSQLCSTSSGDLLVIMESEDRKQKEVVRYSGSRENTVFNGMTKVSHQSRPLYSRSVFNCLCENRNLDICVTINEAM